MDKMDKIKKTMMEMFMERNYDVRQPFSSSETTSFHDAICFDKYANKHVYVYLVPKNKTIHWLKKYMVDTENVRDEHFLMVFSSMPNLSCRKWFMDREAEIFTYPELQFNIVKHTMVPKHIHVRHKNDITKILKLYNVTDKEILPVIKASDPVSRFYAAKKEDLFIIERMSPTAGVVPYLRMVV